jgi:hypothetical protein
MEKAVEHSSDGRAVAEQFSPVLDRAVRRHQCAGAFVRRMTISSNSSAAVGPSLRIPKSSMISRGTVASSSMCSLRFPSRAASAISSFVRRTTLSVSGVAYARSSVELSLSPGKTGHPIRGNVQRKQLPCALL